MDQAVIINGNPLLSLVSATGLSVPHTTRRREKICIAVCRALDLTSPTTQWITSIACNVWNNVRVEETASHVSVLVHFPVLME